MTSLLSDSAVHSKGGPAMYLVKALKYWKAFPQKGIFILR